MDDQSHTFNKKRRRKKRQDESKRAGLIIQIKNQMCFKWYFTT